jgi:hypothetical protein
MGSIIPNEVSAVTSPPLPPKSDSFELKGLSLETAELAVKQADMVLKSKAPDPVPDPIFERRDIECSKEGDPYWWMMEEYGRCSNEYELLTEVLPLGIAYRYTQQQKYAEKAKTYVLAWADAYLNEKAKNNDRYTGFRGNSIDYREYHNLFKTYSYTKNSGVYSTAEIARIEQWMNELGDYFVAVDPYNPATTNQLCGNRTPCFSFRNTGNWNAAAYQLLANIYVVTENPSIGQFLFTKGYWKKFVTEEFVMPSGLVDDIAEREFCASFGSNSGDRLPIEAIADFYAATGYTAQNSGSYTSKCSNTSSGLIASLPYSTDVTSKEYKARRFFLRYPRRSVYLNPAERSSSGSIIQGQDGFVSNDPKDNKSMGYAALHFIHGFDAINVLYQAGYYTPTTVDSELFSRGVEVSLLEMYELMKPDAEAYAAAFGSTAGCNESDTNLTNDCNQGNYRYKGYENAVIGYVMVQKYGSAIEGLPARIEEILEKYKFVNTAGQLTTLNSHMYLLATIQNNPPSETTIPPTQSMNQPTIIPASGTPGDETATPSAVPNIDQAPESPSPVLCPRHTAGDANCDGEVTLIDMEIWRGEFFGEQNSFKADFNKDGKLSLVDLEIWTRTMFP